MRTYTLTKTTDLLFFLRAKQIQYKVDGNFIEIVATDPTFFQMGMMYEQWLKEVHK